MRQTKAAIGLRAEKRTADQHNGQSQSKNHFFAHFILHIF